MPLYDLREVETEVSLRLQRQRRRALEVDADFRRLREKAIEISANGDLTSAQVTALMRAIRPYHPQGVLGADSNRWHRELKRARRESREAAEAAAVNVEAIRQQVFGGRTLAGLAELLRWAAREVGTAPHPSNEGAVFLELPRPDGWTDVVPASPDSGAAALARGARTVADVVGCQSAQAAALIACGFTPFVAPVVAVVHHRLSGSPRAEICVNYEWVSQETVSIAWARARAEIAADLGVEPDARAIGRSDSADALVEFVELRRDRGHRFAEIYEEWQRARDRPKHYSSTNSLSTAFRQAVRRRG